MENTNYTPLIKEVASLLAGLSDPSKFNASIPFTVVPEGFEVKSLEHYADIFAANQEAPRFVEKKIEFIDVASFVTYFHSFRHSHQPRLFVKTEDTGIVVLCVFDYDEPATAEGAPQKPRWNRHVAYLKLAYHRDYKTLRDNADKFHSQEEFALFVEENTHLFIQPDGATMLELAQQLKGSRGAQWESGKHLKDGRVHFVYKETLNATMQSSEAEVPEYLILNTPMFEGFEAQDIRAAFRWRITDSKEIKFGYRLLTKVAERKAEDEVKAAIAKQTELPLLAVSTFNGIRAEA